MKKHVQLNFPPYNFKVSQHGETLRIWDDLRKMWLALTPEEWVRQHLIRFLVEEHAVAPALIRQECPVSIERMAQRADVMVFRGDGTPLLLAECKAPDVKINAGVFSQVVRYNAVLGAEYILVTNGLRHFIHRKGEDGRYTPMGSFPELA